MFTIFILVACSSSKKNISKEEALKIANTKLGELGIKLDKLVALADSSVKNFDDLQRKYDYYKIEQDSFKELVVKIKNHQFWYIYYKPKTLKMGGDAAFFIDKYTGEILYQILGE